MKSVAEIKPNFAPVYAAALYPELAAIFQRHGYALAVHGSLARDFDLIAIPWAESVSHSQNVIDDVQREFAIKILSGSTKKNHGRVAHTLTVGFGECFIDLSFMPCLEVRSITQS